MKQVLKIDSEGYFLEDVILEDSDVTPINCIETLCQGGFFKPQWNGVEWIEGLTQEEIDAIINTPIPKTEVEINTERIESMENALMMLMDMGI